MSFLKAFVRDVNGLVAVFGQVTATTALVGRQTWKLRGGVKVVRA